MTALLPLLLACTQAAEPPTATPAPAAAPTAEALVEPEPATTPEAGCPTTTDGIQTAADPRLAGSAVIVVFKEDRRLGLYAGGKNRACWPVGLAHTYAEGHKQRRGDLRTPEGWYRTSDKPWSSFYAAIAVHYPERADADRGLAEGVLTEAERTEIHEALQAGRKPLQNTALGGEILIHGGGGSSDWTLGCVALDDAHIDALRTHLPRGMATDVLILP